MSERGHSQIRFNLRDVKENEIRDENGEDIFEPTVSQEIDGKNVFEQFGISGVERPVIMHSLENFLRETLRLIHQLDDRLDSEHRYWFLGAGFGFSLRREGSDMDVSLLVDGHWGPARIADKGPQIVKAYSVTVREWVQGIVMLATELLALFQRLNPRTHSFLRDLELQTQELRSWLISSG